MGLAENSIVNIENTPTLEYNMDMMLTQDKESIDQLRFMRAILSERQSEAGRSDREREECKKTVIALDRAVELFQVQVYA